MIFARSNRSTVLLTGGALALAVALAAAATLLAVVRNLLAALVVGMLAVVAMAVAVRTIRRLRRWPANRLAFFRDRLVLVQGRTEVQALWDRIELVSLADNSEWGSARWPEISLTDRLTVGLGHNRLFSFRPAACGLEPIACRDLILRLRDDTQLRLRLPEFDSLLDLTRRPVQTGEFIRPRL